MARFQRPDGKLARLVVHQAVDAEGVPGVQVDEAFEDRLALRVKTCPQFFFVKGSLREPFAIFFLFVYLFLVFRILRILHALVMLRNCQKLNSLMFRECHGSHQFGNHCSFSGF